MFKRSATCHATRRRVRRRRSRRGVVLVVVLVVIMMLALGAYSFTQLMTAELAATDSYERESQARAFADSGIELAAAVLGEASDGALRTNVYNNTALFQEVLVSDADQARRRGRFSLVAPVPPDVGGGIRYGLVDESSKLNLNALVEYEVEEDAQTDSLMHLPGMTADVANAILDWIDGDDTARYGGAEAQYYGSLVPPVEPRNGPLDSLDELLRVRGVTRQLLYGEDANRNGLLDPEENDGAASLPLDNADGVLDLGWAPYLTVVSREANRRVDGTPRINVNGDDLAALYDELLTEFDEETAQFVVAYRMSGPVNNSAGGAGGSSGQSGGQSSGGQSGGQSSGGQTSGGQSSSGQSSGGQSSGRGGASAQGNSGAANGSSPNGSGGQGGQSSGGNTGQGSGGAGSAGRGSTSSEQRGGLAIPSGGGSQQIGSLYDLVGATVQVELNGAQQTLESPWPDEPSELGERLPQMLDALTTTDDETIDGRINVVEAPREVILAIPEIDEQLVPVLLAAQSNSGGAYDSDPLRATTAWLLVEGHADAEQMRTLDRYITGRGDVYRVQAVGHFNSGGPVVRTEALIDATALPPQVVWVRDLSNLGPGYSTTDGTAANTNQ
ncbi:MAG: general secretion pathway protein GspK [Planctomycetales bacterium]|nr:general secretion pathway protein GspK [Planctomycetales bacterium]